MPGPNTPYTQLDANQVLKQAFDESKDRLRVDTEATVTVAGQFEVAIDHTEDSVRLGDGVNLVTTTVYGPTVALDVNIANNTLSIDVSGVYDSGSNPSPDSIGLIASERDVSPTNSTQVNRLTSIKNGDTTALDVALRDENGDPYSALNPLNVVSPSNTISTGSPTTPTVTDVSSVILAANSSRKYVYIVNNSSVVMHIQLGQSAVFGRGIRLNSNSMYEITADNLWTGSIHAIKSTASPELLDVFEGT